MTPTQAVPQRVGRVLWKVVTATVVAVLYYMLTSVLLDSMGRTGFLIALAVLGVAAALAAEFRPHVLRWWKARQAAKADAKPAIERATRAEAEAAFKAGDTGAFYVDEQGKFWTIQADTGKWAFYKGGQWKAGIPLGTLTKAPSPVSAP